MAVRSLGQLTLDLVARVGGFTGPLDQASRAAKKDMANIVSTMKGAATAITATAGTVAAAGGALVLFTKAAADNARELRNQAQVANASVEEFQRYAYASKTVQVEQDKLSDILKDVNDRVGDFLQTGGGPMADFFEQIAPKIGVTADQFRHLSGPQALQLYYDSLERANLSQQDMTFYLEALASDTTSLIPLLRDGGRGFQEMTDEADRLGLVLSELDIAQLDEFGTQFDRITGILGNMRDVVAGELAPYLSVLADEMIENADSALGMGEAFSHTLRTIVEGTAPVLDSLDKILLAAKGLRTFAYTMGQAYTTVFAEIVETATGALDFIAGGLNEVIAGFNHLPGVDVPLIASFNDSAYAQGVRDLRDSLAEFAVEARADLAEAFAAPPPSEGLLAYLDEVDAKRQEIAAGLGKNPDQPGSSQFRPLDDWLFDTPPASPLATENGAASATVDREAERQRDAYQRLLDTLYPLAASQREFREEMELLAQADAAGAVEDLADAQQRLREASAERVAAGMSEAPDYAGLDGSVGGAFGEISKIDQAQEELQGWYDTQLEMLEEFRDARADLNAEWDEREQSVHQQHQAQMLEIERARQLAQLSAAESVFGDLTDITRTFAGEQSGIYKAMFAVQKAAAVAQSIVAIQQGIAMAAANPFPYNLAAMASVASATAGIVSNIASVAAPEGMAHDGIDAIPQTGTWLLEKGERVTTADTSAKLDKTLDDVRRSQTGREGAQAPIINVYEDKSRAGQVTSERREDGQWVINLVAANFTGDGELHNVMQGKYGLSTQGR